MKTVPSAGKNENGAKHGKKTDAKRHKTSTKRGKPTTVDAKRGKKKESAVQKFFLVPDWLKMTLVKIVDPKTGFQIDLMQIRYLAFSVFDIDMCGVIGHPYSNWFSREH